MGLGKTSVLPFAIMADAEEIEAHRIGTYGKTLKVGGQELKDRITNEASNNALVVSLFLTMSMPALMNPPSEISDYLRSVYMLMWTVPVCLQLITLVASINVITSINKLGSDEAIVQFVKRLRVRTFLCISLGNALFGIAQISSFATVLVVFATGFLHFPRFVCILASGAAIFSVLFALGFSLAVAVVEHRASVKAGDIDVYGVPIAVAVPATSPPLQTEDPDAVTALT